MTDKHVSNKERFLCYLNRYGWLVISNGTSILLSPLCIGANLYCPVVPSITWLWIVTIISWDFTSLHMLHCDWIYPNLHSITREKLSYLSLCKAPNKHVSTIRKGISNRCGFGHVIATTIVHQIKTSLPRHSWMSNTRDSRMLWRRQ